MRHLKSTRVAFLILIVISISCEANRVDEPTRHLASITAFESDTTSDVNNVAHVLFKREAKRQEHTHLPATNQQFQHSNNINKSKSEPEMKLLHQLAVAEWKLALAKNMAFRRFIPKQKWDIQYGKRSPLSN